MNTPARILSGRLLARNVVWNLLGAGLPLLVALWAIPRLIDDMGMERFGLLAIIWMAVGYFSLFDLGIGRALTKLIAERLGDGRETELPSLISTGLRLMTALGSIAALIVAAIAPWLARSVLNVPKELVQEAVWSFWILAASLPFVVSTAGLVGVFQAYQNFALVNAVRIPLGIMNFLGPVIALTFTSSLIATTVVLAVVRILGWFAYWQLCRGHPTALELRRPLDQSAVRDLMSFGAWMSVTNIVGPLMVYFDRFLIGALLTMSAVAYYATPYEVVTRFWIFPEALLGVLFPALTTALVADPVRARIIFLVASRLMVIGAFVPVALVMLFAPEALAIWLGQGFARESTPVLRWLAIGVFINCLARLPFAILQGKGRPDLTAKLHLLELPLYFVMLWVFVETFGITGAAAAWTLRIVIDTVALFVLGIQQVPELRQPQLRALALLCGAVVFLAALSLPDGVVLKAVFAGLIVGIGCGLALRELYRIRAGAYGQAMGLR